MLRINREFMEYMRVTYPNTPLSDFKSPDVYVKHHGGLGVLEVDEEDEEEDSRSETRSGGLTEFIVYKD